MSPTPKRQLRPSRRATRRGSIYVLVLLVSMIVMVAGLGAIMLSRANIRSTVATRDWSRAGVAARGGIEYALAVMNTSGTWRSDAGNAAPTGPMTVDGAAVSVALVDEADADLANDPSQPVRVYAAARVGSARRTYSVLAAPASTTGMDVLRCALHTGGTLTVSGNALVSGGPLSSNSNISNSATPTSDVETNTLSSSGFINGWVRTGMAAKKMPGDTAWTALAAVATTIPWGSIPGGTIDRQTLTAGTNAIGNGPNASGVYAIGVPALSTLTIRRSRIQATLLVTLAASAKLVVQDENLWDPPSAASPTLLVKGGLLSSATIGGSTTNAALSEATTGTNYNPANAPYNGVVDSDTLDAYPCELHGVIHFLDSNTAVTIASNLKMVGSVIVAGNATINTAATLTANPTLLSSPPTGYSDASTVKMAPVPGTYRWEVADANP